MSGFLVHGVPNVYVVHCVMHCLLALLQVQLRSSMLVYGAVHHCVIMCMNCSIDVSSVVMHCVCITMLADCTGVMHTQLTECIVVRTGLACAVSSFP